MMTYFLLLFSFLFECLFAENDLNFFEKKAELMWIDRDYSEAKNFYENIQIQELQSWQKARFYYNLGLIEIYKNCPIQALHSFQKIDLSQFSDLKFVRDYFCALTTSNLLQRKENCVNMKDFSGPIQSFLIRKSDQFLTEATLIDEVIQKKEQRENFKNYHPSKILEETKNYWLRSEIENKRMNQEEWLVSSKIEEVVFLLWFSINEILNQMYETQAKIENAHPSNEILSYFEYEYKKTIFLQKKIEESLVKSNQKDHQKDSLKILNKFDNLKFSELILHLEKLKKDLEALNYFPSTQEANFYYSYKILLLKEAPTLSDIQSLLYLLSNIEFSKKDSILFEKIKENLLLSQKALKKNNQNEALFYLWNGFNFERVFFSEDLTPLSVLNDSIDQVKRALKLFCYYELSSKEFKEKDDPIESLIAQQKLILKISEKFIHLVITFQEKMYESKASIYFDWEKIIEFFVKGFQLENENLKLFSKPLSGEEILSNQIETIQFWMSAKELLSSPSEAPINNENFKVDATIQENSKLIQEMYLQDQSSSKIEVKEMLTW